jgi:hypothetical protein
MSHGAMRNEALTAVLRLGPRRQPHSFSPTTAWFEKLADYSSSGFALNFPSVSSNAPRYGPKGASRASCA